MYNSIHKPKIQVEISIIDQLQDEANLSNYLKQKELERRQHKIQSKPKKKPTNRRQGKKTPAMVWLRDKICSLVFGHKTPDKVEPSVRKETLVGRWNQNLQLPTLANYKLNDHFNNLATYYYFGNGSPKELDTLVMVDIDVGKARGQGTTKGANAFAEYLAQTRLPGMYYEPSTNGKGVHGYIVVQKAGRTAKDVNAGLKRLQTWLTAEARRINADIELVEIKGTCPDITFKYGNIVEVKYGSFAKLPRDTTRFNEWQNTTTLDLADLESSDYDIALLEMPEPACARTSGSISGKYVTDDYLDAIPQYEALYNQMTEGKNLQARNHVVIPHDAAAAMVILKFCHDNPKPDGSMPTKRARKLWNALYESGDIWRPWNHHRWKAIRDFLSRQGHINWIDHRYQAPDKDDPNDIGICCKFSIQDDFADDLDIVATLPVTNNHNNRSFVDSPQIREGSGKHRIPTLTLLKPELERRFWQEAYKIEKTLYAA